MKTDNNLQNQKYLRAKKRVDDIKDFYTHLTVYFLVNLFISITRVVEEMKEGLTLEESLLDFGTFAVWIFWGVGVLFHAFYVFGANVFLGKDWEERKIKKYLNENN